MSTRVYTYGTRGMIEEWSTLRKYHSCTVVSVEGVKICIDCGSPALFRHVLNADALVISHCFDEKTEIFTNHGWKKFPELSGLDQVATLDDEGYLTFEKPVDYIEQDYVGPMYYLDTDFLNMMVTPNHKLYVIVNPRESAYLTLTQRDPEHPDYSAFKPVQALECFGRVKRFKSSFKWKGVQRVDPFFRENLSEWVRLLGWVLSEGHCGTWNVSVHNCDPKVVDEVVSLWRKLGFEPSLYSKVNHCGKIAYSVVVHNAELARRLKEYGVVACEKRVPEWIKELTPEYIKLFLDSYFRGDGSWGGRGSAKRIATASPRMSNDLQELIFKIGDTARITPRKGGYCSIGPNAPYKCKDYFVVKWVRTHKTPLDRHQSNKLSTRSVEAWVPYEGKIYCVTLPNHTNHTVLVRRGGRVHWSLNSHPDHTLGLVDKKIEVPTSMGEFSTHMDPVPSYFKKIEFKNLKVVKRRVKVKGLTIEFVPTHHSLRCPMCAIYFPDLRLMVATDIVAPVGGWSQWKRKIRFYVGDCSSPAAPIIRRRNGKIFGHASVVSQIKALGDKHYLFTHHGRQTIELKEREVIKRIGAPIKVAKDGDVFDLDDERGFVRR